MEAQQDQRACSALAEAQSLALPQVDGAGLATEQALLEAQFNLTLPVEVVVEEPMAPGIMAQAELVVIPLSAAQAVVAVAGMQHREQGTTAATAAPWVVAAAVAAGRALPVARLVALAAQAELVAWMFGLGDL